MSTLAHARRPFGELLDYHFKRGTRPDGNTDHPGRMWTTQAFAHAVGYGDRAVRHWLNDRHLPADLETIERVLFGLDYTRYPEWRFELRDAHMVGLRSARSSRRRQKYALRAATTSDIVLPNNSGHESTSTACVLGPSTQ